MYSMLPSWSLRASRNCLFGLVLVAISCFNDSMAEFISCDNPCDGGDVNYNLVASIRTMKLLNYTYKGRTYSREGDNESLSLMGPTMRVRPGQSLWIKLTNNMTDASLGPSEPGAVEYWNMLRDPGENIKYQFYKAAVAEPALMKLDHPNIPKHFSSTNLHLHGLDIEVHMFDPINTHDPKAPHIVVDPGECYCYQFNIPEHHPTGMYWYHPHLHGSTALQIWGGMMGLLYIEGPLEEELQRQGVRQHSEEFVIWDPALRNVDEPTHNLEVDDFLMGQTTLSKIHPFLVNGQMTPNFRAVAGEPLHLRVLCGTIENENTFIVYPAGMEENHWNVSAVPFWVIASDGVTYEKPRQTRILVMAGGQREELLLEFPGPGEYVISQQGIEGYQFFDMRGHPHNQILATITVVEPQKERQPVMPISAMRFTPGYTANENIQSEDIVQTETIVFSMGANRDQAPFPQYYVNGRAFDPDRLDFFAQPGEAREYILINAQHNVHPFHIHVNRFQVQEMGSEFSAETYPVLEAVLDFDPHTWRDTVIVPPNGRARIWVQYKNYTGKTVFHCHFLAHEDTGMMSTLFIGKPRVKLYQWLTEHLELLLGVAVGMFLSVMLLLGCAGSQKRWRDGYVVAEMNDLKSKAVD